MIENRIVMEDIYLDIMNYENEEIITKVRSELNILMSNYPIFV